MSFKANHQAMDLSHDSNETDSYHGILPQSLSENNINDKSKNKSSKYDKNKKFYIKTLKNLLVKPDPHLFSESLYEIHMNKYLCVTQDKIVDSLLWFNIGCGWIIAFNQQLGNDTIDSFVMTTKKEAKQSWEYEKSQREKAVAALGGLLLRSYNLSKARRIAKSITNSFEKHPNQSLLNLPREPIDHLILALSKSLLFKQSQAEKYIKMIAAQSSNPKQSVIEIAKAIEEVILSGPAKWVDGNNPVLHTYDVQARNDSFITSASKGDIEVVTNLIFQGQDILALHSELKYTALHAAVVFGKVDIVRVLLLRGISVDIQDTRLEQTALHFAGENDRQEIISILLEHSANRLIKNIHGFYPYEVAYRNRYYHSCEMLKLPPSRITEVNCNRITTRSIYLTWTNIQNHLDLTQQASVSEYLLHVEILESEKSKSSDNTLLDIQSYTTNALSPTKFKSIDKTGDEIKSIDTIIESFDVVSTNPSSCIENLHPFSRYSITIYAKSAAGISLPSSSVIYMTLPDVPDTPPPIDVLKVDGNGILIQFFPSRYSNGGIVDYYQIEIVDEDSGNFIAYESNRVNESSQTIMNSRDTFTANSSSQSFSSSPNRMGTATSSLSPLKVTVTQNEEFQQSEVLYGNSFGEDDSILHSIKQSFTKTSDERVNSAMHVAVTPSVKTLATIEKDGKRRLRHRLIKHSQLNYLFKYISGLETNAKYRIRVRVHNEFGYSKFCEWSDSIIPRLGITTSHVGINDAAMLFTWFQPILKSPRKVTKYELQICTLKGNHIIKNLNFEIKSSLKQSAGKQDKIMKSDKSNLEYVTLRNDIETDYYIVHDLQPGLKYMCRVRPCLNDVWLDWDFSINSEIFFIQSRHPDPPTKLQQLKTHNILPNQITLQWKKGKSNGKLVEKYEILCSKVVRPQDIGVEDESSINETEIIYDEFNIDHNKLVFENITDVGIFHENDDEEGVVCFTAKSLATNSSYIFKIRQANENGWSKFSDLSPIITLYASNSPPKPVLAIKGTKHIIIEWDEDFLSDNDEDNQSLHVLGYEVHYSMVPPSWSNYIGNVSSVQTPLLSNEIFTSTIEWQNTNAIVVPHTFALGDDGSILSDMYHTHLNTPADDNNDAVRTISAIVDNLVSASCYIFRVRAKTVGGWSDWSEPSDIIQTLSIQ